jgi:hypothetical protein
VSVADLFQLRDHPQHDDLSQFGCAAQERLNGLQLETKTAQPQKYSSLHFNEKEEMINNQQNLLYLGSLPGTCFYSRRRQSLSPVG